VDWKPDRSSNLWPDRGARPATICKLAGSALAVALLGAIAGCGADRSTGPTAPDRAVVVEVVDGDTVELAFGDRRERVRLLGVDAPESVHPSVPVQCFGAEASNGLAGLLRTGTEVRVERDVEARDRYDRLLLYLYRVEDGVFVNRWLVANGLADTAFYEPNTTRSSELTSARATARATSIGLWGRCDGPDQPLE